MKALVLLAAACLILTGCGSSTPQATSQQSKDFKGGPMPEDFKAKFAQMQKESAPKPGRN